MNRLTNSTDTSIFIGLDKKFNILISRTDAIGDVVLSFPIAGHLKQLFPDCTIYFLGQIYTKDVIESCKHIDKFINWQEIKKLHYSEQILFFKQLEINIAIHVYPNIQISWLLKKAKVDFRIGTSRRWYHWIFCNRLISLSRHKSNLHETQLNTILLQLVGLKNIPTLSTISESYGLAPQPLPDKWQSLLDKDKFNLIIHPKSRGNGKEWGLKNYHSLINQLDTNRFKVFITGTQKELKEINTELLAKNPHITDLVDKLTLKELISFISQADGLVASGTGPLHLAAALGIHAVGLFPPIRPIFSRRWGPVGINSKSFEATKTCLNCHKNTKCECLQKLNPSVVSGYISHLSKPMFTPHIETKNNLQITLNQADFTRRFIYIPTPELRTDISTLNNTVAAENVRTMHLSGQTSTLFHVLFFPLWQFIRCYLFEFQFFKGKRGIKNSLNIALEVYSNYSNLRDIIAKESRINPFRFCNICRTDNSNPVNEIIRRNSEVLSKKDLESIVVFSNKSEVTKLEPNSPIFTFSYQIRNYSYLNLYKIIKLARYFKRMRVKTVVTDNTNDLKIICICARMLGISNIYFYLPQSETISAKYSNKFLFQNYVNKVFINNENDKYIVLMYNFKLFTKDKIYILGQTSNFALSDDVNI